MQSNLAMCTLDIEYVYIIQTKGKFYFWEFIPRL